MATLQQIRFLLTFPKLATPTGNSGELAHGLLFNLLGAMDRNFASTLHNRMEKPFTISPVDLAPDSTGAFTVSTLSVDMGAALGALGHMLPRTAALGLVPVQVTALEPLHPAPLPYEALFDYRALPRQVGLRFRTPTSFRRQGEQILLPEPGLVFGSLLARFNTLSPFPFPDEARLQLQRLRISRYDLRTSQVVFGAYKIIGFTGRVIYTFPPEFPPQMAYLAAALGRFATFAGVGYKTTMGLGQVDLIEREVME